MIGVPDEGSCLLPIGASAETYLLEVALMQHLMSHLTLINGTTAHGLNDNRGRNDRPVSRSGLGRHVRLLERTGKHFLDR